ncbi:MAG: hypothetical protein WAV11_02960 [Minisyncoccia bacterium]
METNTFSTDITDPRKSAEFEKRMLKSKRTPMSSLTPSVGVYSAERPVPEGTIDIHSGENESFENEFN